MLRYCIVEPISVSSTGIGGYKEASALVNGTEVFARLKFESGVHRVQRVPETESSERLYTSAATVAILLEVEEVDFKIEEKDLRIDVYRPMISVLLILGVLCATRISSQLYHNFHLPSHFYILKKFPSGDLERFSGENIDDTISYSKNKRMISERRTQLTQLNRLLKKPVFNFANLFRHH